MTTVYIIRHGKVVFPRDSEGQGLMYPPETRLSEEGLKGIEKLAAHLKEKGIKFDCIETSPFVRAEQTAAILARVLGTEEMVLNSAFQDPHVPGWIGKPIAEQQELMAKGEDLYMHKRSEDQETYVQVIKRADEGFRNLVKRNEGRTVALVSHGDIIRLILYRLENPEGEVPNMSVLNDKEYLQRGEALRLRFDERLRMIEKKRIPEEEGVRGERETL